MLYILLLVLLLPSCDSIRFPISVPNTNHTPAPTVTPTPSATPTPTPEPTYTPTPIPKYKTLHLVWDANPEEEQVAFYEVYCIESKELTWIKMGEPTVTELYIRDLPYDNHYRCRVYAVNKDRDRSDASDIANE